MQDCRFPRALSARESVQALGRSSTGVSEGMTIRLLAAAFLTAALLSACGNASPSPTVTVAPEAALSLTPDPTETYIPETRTMSGCVITNSLRVREAPSTQSKVITGLTRGECVEVHGADIDRTWAAIRVDGQVGWVSLKYLSLEGDPAELPTLASLPASVVLIGLATVPVPPTSTIAPPSPLPTSTRTDTPIPPTATATRTKTPVPPTPTARPTRTDTPVPPTLTPTSTDTPIPPTPTSTGTDTPAPPTLTPTNTNTPVPPTPDIPPCWNTAREAGEWISCRVWVAYCSQHPEIDGSPTLCNDAPYPNSQFTLLVWESDWSDLNGKCIVVTGRVVLSGGKPQIVATSRSQVSICR